ncbi:MAG: hypothetical protein HY600_02165 [Candidatus Omnitrophica bacterium]|nr:hypothetical protein [Candidatus Omnitrophota bacterium]
MTIVFYGARQAGCIALLTLLAKGHAVPLVIPADELVAGLAERLGLPAARPVSINAPDSLERLRALRPDLLVCCHGPEIFRPLLLALPRLGCVNLHPCLSGYPGARAVERFLAAGGTRASVGAHRMTEVVDGGPVLAEQFVDARGCRTPVEIYNRLYPLYSTVLVDALAAAQP